VILARSRGSQVERFIAVPRFVIVSLTLLSIHMSDIVCIILLELVTIYISFASEFALPHCHAFFHSETHSFEEQTKLETTVMLQMMLVFQSHVKRFDAGWESFSRVEV